MHQELNHGSKVRAAVGVRGCRSIQTLSRLLVSPLCDLSIYVGFLILKFFFEKKTCLFHLARSSMTYQTHLAFLKAAISIFSSPSLFRWSENNSFLPTTFVACCIFNWLCPVSLYSSEWGLSCNWLRFYFK